MMQVSSTDVDNEQMMKSIIHTLISGTLHSCTCTHKWLLPSYLVCLGLWQPAGQEIESAFYRARRFSNNAYFLWDHVTCWENLFLVLYLPGYGQRILPLGVMGAEHFHVHSTFQDCHDHVMTVTECQQNHTPWSAGQHAVCA